MNAPLRNFPKPPLATVYADCGLSARTAIVAALCERTNEVLEYTFGLEASQIEAPAQANIDERMPLKYLRPCATAVNAIILAEGFDIELLPVPGNNMDYHGFVPLTRRIAEALNAIIDQL